MLLFVSEKELKLTGGEVGSVKVVSVPSSVQLEQVSKLRRTHHHGLCVILRQRSRHGSIDKTALCWLRSLSSL